MKSTLTVGVTRRETLVVDDGRTIGFLGPSLRVYSTPSMVNDVEYACFRLLAQHLDEGESSLGVHVAVEHLAGTPPGETVLVDVEVVGVDGRRVEFEAQVRDAEELLGRGRHARVVIDVARFAQSFARKRERLRSRPPGR